MSLRLNRFSLSRAALAALLVTTAASAAADVLVVRSSGPSAKNYQPGQRVADDARLRLQSGDTVVLLDARGTRTFRGPGLFSPSSAVQAGTHTVAGPDGRRARIGAVRSAGIVPASPTTIWDVDVSQGGTLCLANTSDVRLWRPDASEATELTITGPGGASQSVEWPAGTATITWPDALPLRDGAEYQLNRPGTAVPTRIRVKTLSAPPTDLEAVAEALISNGCPEQLELLVATAPTL